MIALDQQIEESETKTSEPTETELIILPVGLNVGKRNVVPSALVKGLEDGTTAVDFPNWLIPIDDVVDALKLNIDKEEDGVWQVTAPGLVTRIDSQELINDSDLGLAISVDQIQTWLKVPTEFDPLEYAIVFNPPWLDLRGKRRNLEEISIITEGLPLVSPRFFTLTALGQEIDINRTIRENATNDNPTNYQGELTAIGTLLGGGWHLGIGQNEFGETASWNLDEAQWWYQSNSTDYIIGSQPTFWRREGAGDYWGLTTIRRWGFEPQKNTFGTFNPSQRFQADQVQRSITGEAPPGTLAQLVTVGDRIVQEVLVDESGIYSFDAIPTKGENYRVLLYPEGLLTVEPEIETIKFTDVPELLPKGGSLLTLGTGLRRKREEDFIGQFRTIGGGIAYRRGVLEDVTLGIGLYHDNESLRALGEIFYQPAQIPLRVSISSLSPDFDSPWEFQSRINFNPAPNFNLSLDSDLLSQRIDLNWQISRNFSFVGKGKHDDSDSYLAGGIRFSYSSPFSSTFAGVELNTNNELVWSFNQRLGSLRLEHRRRDDSTKSRISYNFSRKRLINGGHFLVLNYDTRDDDYLGSIGWRYRSPRNPNKGVFPWEFSLGYGSGSSGSGLIASVGSEVIPGMLIRLRYEQVSISSGDDRFRLELSPRLNLQNGIRSGPNQREFRRLRGAGGLWIKPFYDYNNNEILDGKDKIFTEDANLMLVLNNKPIRSSRPEIKKDGVFVTVSPGMYRLDLDPAGFPFDWTSSVSSLAIKVAPGSYTEVLIPFSLSYIVSGVVTNTASEPVNGARVEAIPQEEGETIFSVTNPAGVFYLEGLKQGSYDLKINGNPSQPNKLIINESSEPFQELNLKQNP